MITFMVPKVEKVEMFEGPALTVKDLKEGKTAMWLRWRQKRWVEVVPEKMLQSLPAPPVVWPDFWGQYGPLVATHVWDWTKAFLKDMLEEGWSCTPVEAAESAFNLLYFLLEKKRPRVKNVDKAKDIAAFLQEGYKYLPLQVQQSASPPKDILIVGEKDCLEAVLPSSLRPWNRDYTLRVPVKGQELLNEKRKGKPFNGKVLLTPGGKLKVYLPCIFPAILDCILNRSPVLCACGCGQVAQPGSKYADPSHRKRLWWRENRGKNNYCNKTRQPLPLKG